GRDDISRQPFGKLAGGCRGQVFDRAGSLQTAICSVEYIGHNSTAALPSQPSHFSVRGRIGVDTQFSPDFSGLAFRWSPIRSTASRRPPACECATAFCQILGVPPSAYLRG